MQVRNRCNVPCLGGRLHGVYHTLYTILQLKGGGGGGGGGGACSGVGVYLVVYGTPIVDYCVEKLGKYL